MVGRQTNFEYGAHEINNISQPGINQIVYFTSRTEIPCKLTMYLDYYGSSRIRLKCPKMPILRLVDCFWVAVETNKWSWWFQRIMVTEDAKNKLYNHIIIIVEKKYVFFNMIWLIRIHYARVNWKRESITSGATVQWRILSLSKWMFTLTQRFLINLIKNMEKAKKHLNIHQ